MGSVLSNLMGGKALADTESPPRDLSPVVDIHDINRWNLHFNCIKESNQLLVIYFSATWCGPCRIMEPAIVNMATRVTDVQFAKIDVDELPDVSGQFKVEAMPTFVLVRQGKEVGRVVGAKRDELEKKVGENKAP